MRLVFLSPLSLSLLVASAVGVATVGAPPARAGECLCDNLPALQAELRNAQRLQAAFRNRISALRAMGPGESQAALQQFAGSDARNGLEPIPGYNGPSEFDYVPYGQNVDPSRFDAFTADQLCAMAASAAQRLEQATRAAACDGIAEALRVHEHVHVNFCRRIGYRAYLAMHGADRAQEEAEAYGAQIAALRAAIAHVLERARVRVDVEVNTRMQMPPNPAYTAITVRTQGQLRTNRGAMNGDLIRFEAQGTHSVNAGIEGNCSFTGPLPFTVGARGSIETDGLDAQIRYQPEGTSPAIGMQCQIPGRGRGTGMMMPAPMNLNGNTPPAFNLPLRDGAEMTYDMATSEAAQIATRGGVRMSGQGRMRLTLECSSGN